MNALSTVVAPLLFALATGSAVGDEPVRLVPTAAADTPVAVRVGLTLGGDLTAERAGPTAAAPAASPVAMTAKLAYRQQPLAEGDPRAVRQYTIAEVTYPGGPVEPALRPDRRLIVAEPTKRGPRAYAVGGALRRSEADLLQLAGDPLYADRLLPNEPVREGDTWDISSADAVALVALDEASIADLSAVLTDLTEGHARFRFAGTVQGTIDGAETQIDLRGVALFDRRAGRVSRLNLAVQERRGAGPVTPSLDAGMKINVAIDPAFVVGPIAEDDLRRAAQTPADTRLLIESPAGDWEMLAPRDWFVVGGGRSATRLRLLADGRIGASATIRTLSADRPVTVARLENDVRYSLGKRLSRVLASDQWTTTGGHRCVAIGAEGKQPDGSPAAWRHYHVTPTGDPGAGAVAVAVTLPATDEASPAPVGRQLVETLRLSAANHVAPATAAATGGREAATRR